MKDAESVRHRVLIQNFFSRPILQLSMNARQQFVGTIAPTLLQGTIRSASATALGFGKFAPLDQLSGRAASILQIVG